MTHLLHPQSGWPFALSLEIDYRLSAEGLTVQTRARATSARGRAPTEPARTRT